MRVRLTPEAQLELREATEWYAERSPRAVASFVAAYKHARALIADLPTRGPRSSPASDESSSFEDTGPRD